MATPGFKALIQITGGALATVNEAFTMLSGDISYQVTNAAKRVIDWNTALTVQRSLDGGASYTTVTNYSVDYLFGKITFTVANPVGTLVRASYNYLPLYTFAEGRDVSFDVSAAELDTTVFGDTDTHRIHGLFDLSGSITSLTLLNVTLDAPGTSEKTLAELLNDRDFVVLTYKPDSAGTFEMRAVVMFSSQALSQAVDGLAESTISFMGVAPKGLTGNQVVLSYA
jgi:hypothetical protein